MPDDLPPHPAMLLPEILLKDCKIERTRASGPGGQHRNKVETAIRVTHLPTGIHAQASERRSQAENQKVAIFRLRINLAMDDCSEYCSSFPTKLWQSRSHGKRIACNPKHNDFPALLAEAMMVMRANEFNPAAAGKVLNVSTSQLIKFLKDAPHAFERVNQKRKALNLHPLR